MQVHDLLSQVAYVCNRAAAIHQLDADCKFPTSLIIDFSNIQEKRFQNPQIAASNMGQLSIFFF